MRCYLDTNIVVFMLANRLDELTVEARNILGDYASTLLLSSVALHELLHLCQIGKLDNKKGKSTMKPEDVMGWLEEAGITVAYTNARHFEQYASLPMLDDHRDPNDRLIIAQAISDRIPLVSSDRKFGKYERCGLELVFNER